MLELVVVVVILAILAAAAAVHGTKTIERGHGTEATTYLVTLRAAEMRYRATNASNVYTNQLADLDVELSASLPPWGVPAFSAPATIGLAVLTRVSGAYAGQTVGIQYGTATLCGTFAPLQPLPACAAD